MYKLYTAKIKIFFFVQINNNKRWNHVSFYWLSPSFYRGSSATVFQDAHLWSKTTTQAWTGTSWPDSHQTWADFTGGKVCLPGQLQQECVRTFLRRYHQKTNVWWQPISSYASSGCCPKICPFQINPLLMPQELFCMKVVPWTLASTPSHHVPMNGFTLSSLEM